MKQITPYLVTGAFFFILGILLCSKCSENKYKIVNTIEYQFKDTLFVTKILNVPEPIIKWVDDVKWKHDTTYQTLVDTFTQYYGYPEQMDSFPINFYQDSTSFMGVHSTDIGTAGTVRLKWSAETQGYLISLIPEITFIPDSIEAKVVIKVPKKSPWTFSAGISNRLSAKVGVGYKGWSLEPTINFNKLNPQFQLFLTKTFTINAN